MKHTLVVGSGIGGLLAAMLLRKEGRKNILVAEQASAFGGALRCFDYGEFGKFDYGVHNFLDTGISDIDELFHKAMARDRWDTLSGSRRDLAGTYWHGKLQHETQFVQVNRLPDEQLGRGLRDFFVQLSADGEGGENAEAYFDRRFGRSFSRDVFGPIVEKVFSVPAAKLHRSAAAIVPLSRFSLGAGPVSDLVLSNPLLRSKIAYGEQRELPLEFSSGRAAFYPSHYGMYRLIDAVRAELEEQGVKFLASTRARSASVENGGLSRVRLESGSEQMDLEVDFVVWSAGQVPLARFLGIAEDFPYDKAKKTYVANFLMKKPPASGDLFYFYIYDQGFESFRVTNYAAFCSGEPRTAGYPVSVELLSSDALDDGAICKRAIEEMERLGVASRSSIIFSRGEALQEHGFPLASLVNVGTLNAIRERISAKGIRNLVPTGIHSSKGLFFQTDILIDTYRKLTGTRG